MTSICLVSSLSLTDQVVIVDSRREEKLVEAEDRSHAFNYMAMNDSHLLGLPAVDISKLRYNGPYFEDMPSQINYFYMSNDMLLQEAGIILEERATGIDREDCLVSCEEWYGMTRPIFIWDRIFGLLGFEVVEGYMSGAVVEEKARIDTSIGNK